MQITRHNPGAVHAPSSGYSMGLGWSESDTPTDLAALTSAFQPVLFGRTE